MTDDVERGYFYISDLLVKAGSSLAKCDLTTPSDVERMSTMIGKMNDPYRKTILFSRLAFFFWREGRRKHFSEIVNGYIWPILSSLSDGNDYLVRDSAWRSAYPVVWLEDRDRARNGIREFSSATRNECTAALCYALLRSQPPGEPFDDDSGKKRSRFDYADIQNLLQLCEETDDDSMIFFVFDWVAQEVASQHGNVRITRPQRAEISRRMIGIAETRLPVASRIAHNGYQILCKGLAFQIHAPTSSKWDSLVRSGEAINNAADKCFVLSSLAVSVPKKMGKLRRKLLDTAETIADSLGTAEDKHSRCYRIASIAMDSERELALRSIKKAFEMVARGGGQRNAVREQKIVDLAYRLNPELPLELSSIYDDDPAKEEYRERAERQVAEQELKRTIGNPKSSFNIVDVHNDPNLAVAAWEALGSLNAGRMIPVDMNRSRDMFGCASDFPLDTSYPMYSWAISNVMLKYANTPSGNIYIRDVFEGVLRGVDFFSRMIEEDGGLRSNPDWRDLGDTGSHIVVGIGERNRGIRFLKDWLREHAEEYITIVDPYFGKDDVALIGLIMEVDSSLRIRVVTGKAHQGGEVGSLPEAFASSWRQLYEHSPPETEILVVGGVNSGSVPFHDRWILSKAVGLRVGTSFGGLGRKDSEISILKNEEHSRIGHWVDKYLRREIRDIDGEKLVYQLFDLAT